MMTKTKTRKTTVWERTTATKAFIWFAGMGSKEAPYRFVATSAADFDRQLQNFLRAAGVAESAREVAT